MNTTTLILHILSNIINTHVHTMILRLQSSLADQISFVDCVSLQWVRDVGLGFSPAKNRNNYIYSFTLYEYDHLNKVLFSKIIIMKS